MRCYKFFFLRLVLFIFFLNTFCANAQDISQTYIDSISKLDYPALLDIIINNDGIFQKKISEIYLNKAKQENNKAMVAEGYSILSSLIIDDLNKAIVYLDSAIMVSKRSNDYYYPSLIYLQRGGLEEKLGNFHNALNDYLESIKYAKKVDNMDAEYYAKHNIGVLRRNIGDYKEAKKMFKECISYEYSRKSLSYNDSISIAVSQNELIHTYIYEKQIDSSLILNEKSLLKYEKIELKEFFFLNQGINDFHNNNLIEAEKKISYATNEISNLEYSDFDELYYLIFSKLYLGKTLLKQGEINKSEIQFEFIDSISNSQKYYHPIIKESLIHLISINKNKNDSENELKYINQLLEIDSIIDKQTRLINNKIIKDYDIPELLEKKEILISKLKKDNSKSLSFIFSLILTFFLIIILITWIYKRKNKTYEKKYKELINKYEDDIKFKISKPISKINKVKSIDISKDVIEKILVELDNFENEKGFLEKNISVSSLASKFNTNSKYLSKVINFSKEKTFTTYINELRINHFIKMIQTNPKARKYTINALASENGFSSTEVFAKTFKKITGLYPSYFIKQQNQHLN